MCVWMYVCMFLTSHRSRFASPVGWLSNTERAREATCHPFFQTARVLYVMSHCLFRLKRPTGCRCASKFLLPSSYFQVLTSNHFKTVMAPLSKTSTRLHQVPIPSGQAIAPGRQPPLQAPRILRPAAEALSRLRGHSFCFALWNWP